MYPNTTSTSHQGKVVGTRLGNDFKNSNCEVTAICSSYEKRELVLLHIWGGGLSRKNMLPMPSKCRAEDAAVAM